MSPEDFVRRHEATWARAEEILDRVDARRLHEHELAELPELYRRTCHHLALVRQRHFGAALEARLNRIALRGYRRLYRRRRESLRAALGRHLGVDFPRQVRRHAAFFWLATALFYGAGAATGLLVLADPEAVHAVLGEQELAQFEAMYGTAITADRGLATDFAQFGFYVKNNVGIAFRTFAGGVFAGLGTLFFLVANGVYLGAVFAHLVHAGSASNLLTFVVTHGAFELTALVIAGVAGLRLGAAVVAPGRRTRVESLRHWAPVAVELALGAAAMLLAAAYVEAFWSASAWATPTIKLAVGAVAWVAVAAYLLFAGRRGGP